jgi:hypothetical protein
MMVALLLGFLASESEEAFEVVCVLHCESFLLDPTLPRGILMVLVVKHPNRGQEGGQH